MNHVFLEERSKEKLNNLRNEGVRSQEHYRNRSRKPSFLHIVGKGITAILKVVAHKNPSREKRRLNSHQRS